MPSFLTKICGMVESKLKLLSEKDDIEKQIQLSEICTSNCCWIFLQGL